MIKHFLSTLNIVLVFSLLMTIPASAQGSLPPDLTGNQKSVISHPPQPQLEINPDQKTQPSVNQPLASTPNDIGIQSLRMGLPGTSFRYLQTFGASTEAYPTDDTHLNTPNGMFIDGKILYVVEERGTRMLKYDMATEPYSASLIIGQASTRWAHDSYLGGARSVTPDSAGNVWIAMGPAVKQFDSAGNLIQSIPTSYQWQTGTDNYHFGQPNDVIFGPGGYLYVTDADLQRIQVYDVTPLPAPAGPGPQYVTTIGITGQTKTDNTGFNYPARIVFDSLDRMYVNDMGNFRVQRCTGASSWTAWSCDTVFGDGTEGFAGDLTRLGWAMGLAIHNDVIYIGDGSNARVLQCTIGTISLDCTVYADSTIDPTNANFDWIGDVAVDVDNKVYISDFNNHRIQIFEDTGSGAIYQNTLGTSGVPYATDTTRLNGPWGVTVGTDGSVYVVESYGMRLKKMNSSGVQQWTAGEAGVFGSDNAHFNIAEYGPIGNPAVDASNKVYVSDTWNHRIKVYNSNGSLYTIWGSWGSGNNQFDAPTGIVIQPTTGDIYVADMYNHRIQVFNSTRVYKFTIGLTDSAGRDNYRFNSPSGLALDSAGNVFVADSENNRVQKCTISAGDYDCITFAGLETSAYSRFNYNHPVSVAVDAAGRVYVADDWNNRVQVYDTNGAFLTSIGENWGSNNGDMTSPRGIALDSNGNLYVSEIDNHRIQKFAAGTTSWKQVNINGFGTEGINLIASMTTFGTYLYAGTTDGQLWRSSNGSTWRPILANGFNNSGNDWIESLFVFGNKLYAGTYNSSGNGAQLWRSANGLAWEEVTPNGSIGWPNAEMMSLGSYNNNLYFATWSYDITHGVEIWRSPTGNGNAWTQIEGNGFGDPGNISILSFQTFNSNYYVSTYNFTTGAEIWRSANGNPSSWTQVNTDGFGNINNGNAVLTSFGGYLYAATGQPDGAPSQIWRCQTCNGSDWIQVTNPFVSDVDARRDQGLIVWNGAMYYVGGTSGYGMKVFKTTNGTSWTEVATAGFGNKNNYISYFSNSLAVFNQQLYIGTGNYSNGGQIWRASLSGATSTYYSNAAEDGWILESTETSNTGGSLNATTATFMLGDNVQKRQYRGILSFDTSLLPDHAVITSATLRIKQSGAFVGANPFTVLNGLLLDIRNGWFGTTNALATADFNAPATVIKTSTFNKVPVASWYSAVLNATGNSTVNKTGLTQFRLYFTLDDNNNTIADYMNFFSGNGAVGSRPELIIKYNLP